MRFPNLTQGLLGDPRRPYLAVRSRKLVGLDPKNNLKLTFRRGSERVSQGLPVIFYQKISQKMHMSAGSKIVKRGEIVDVLLGKLIGVLLILREYIQR